MKKKILIVVTKSNFGGAQRYVYDLATNLSPHNFDVTVAFGPGPEGKPGALAAKLTERNIRTILISELDRDVHLKSDIDAARALITLFKSEKPDIVHLNSSKAGGLGALAARVAHVPRIVFTIHGLPFDEARPPYQRILIALSTWATMCMAHATIAVSEDTHSRARRFPFVGAKIFLIRNGIFSPAFLSRDDARDELRLLDPSLLPRTDWIGAIGELHPNKNHALAIDAIAHSEDTHLVILGSGELLEYLQGYADAKKVRDRVHFLGFIPEAARYLRAFDCMVLPSQKEGTPYVLLEAGYAYIPVIATDIPGVREMITNEETGILVPSHESGVLAKAFDRILGDARLARGFADEHLKRIQKKHSFERMLSETSRLYTDFK